MMVLSMTVFAQVAPSQEPVVSPVLTQEAPKVQEAEKFKVGGEIRFRYEARENSDFNSSVDDLSNIQNSRVRLNVSLFPHETLEGFIQAQLGYVWGQGEGTVAPSGAITNGVLSSGGLYDPKLSLHQAYVIYKPFKKVHFKLGRQEMMYGDHVVIGNVGFHNIGRTFDAAVVRFLSEHNTSDVFFSKLAESEIAGTGFAGDELFAGLYSSFKKVWGLDELDLYGLYLRDKRAGDPLSFGFGTFGLRLKNKGSALDYRLESNVQAGKRQAQKMFAYMADAEMGWRFKESRLGLEYNIASGDDGDASNTFTRYHPLFSTVHKWFGYMDYLGRQNIQSGVLHASHNISEKWNIQADLHSFYRVCNQDFVYALATETRLSGQTTPIATQKKHIGEELDLTLKYKANKHVELEAMGGLFMPGAYLNTSLGSDDLSYFSYLSATFSL